jgi:hypothetical protein
MALRRLIAFFLMASFLGAVSCSDGPRVIPKSKMQKIYHEMLVADQWLADNPDKRSKADTTWFYEPIFEKYGYTYDDYLCTVDDLLNDPGRFSDLIGKVAQKLEDESASLRREVEKEDALRHRADSIAAAVKASSSVCPLYNVLFAAPNNTSRINVIWNRDGVLFPEPVFEDTMFFGPGMVFGDSLRCSVDSAAADSVRRYLVILDEVESLPEAAEDTIPAPEIAREFSVVKEDAKDEPFVGKEVKGRPELRNISSATGRDLPVKKKSLSPSSERRLKKKQ